MNVRVGFLISITFFPLDSVLIIARLYTLWWLNYARLSLLVLTNP